MTSYVRISTPSRSATARVSAFGRTLKPTTMPPDAAASMTSFSVIPPTPWWMTFTRMGDRLAGLRHDGVVCGDDEHGDVRDLRASGAHRRERLVARRVEERDLA